jgi:ABC-type Fe3+-siderophore transport system permease subunit
MVNKIMNNKLILALVAIIISVVFSLSEKNLGTPCVNVCVFSAIFGIICGAFTEVIRFFVSEEKKYNIKNILPWIVGALIGTIGAFLI